MPDRNQISITSDASGNVYVNGKLTIAAGLPRENRVLRFEDLRPADGGISDTLKFSWVRNLTVMVNRIVGGVEDCIDVNNRCSDLVIFAEVLEPRGRYVATIKGESENIRIYATRIEGRGKETDFDLGNRSEQAKGRTKDVTISVTEATHEPVRLRVMHAWEPTVKGSAKFKVNTTLKGWIGKLFPWFPLIWCVAFITLAGCRETMATKPPTVVVSETGPKTEEQIKNLKDQVETSSKLAQQAAGAVYGASDANRHNPDGMPKEAVASQLEEAASALPAPTPEQKAAKAEQNGRILAGQLAEVKKEMGQAITENQALRGKLAESEKREAEITAAAEKERREAAAKLQRQFDEMTKRIADAQAATKEAESRARNQVMQAQVIWLNRSAVGLGAIAVLSIGVAGFFGGIAALRGVAPFAAICFLGALVCFGMAQIVGQAWFMWAVLAVVCVALGVTAVWVWKKYKLGTLKEDAEAKVAKLKKFAGTVVPVLDQAYEEADKIVQDALDDAVQMALKHGSTGAKVSGQKILDDLIFSKLSTKMDASEKRAVHEIRAETTTSQPQP